MASVWAGVMMMMMMMIDDDDDDDDGHPRATASHDEALQAAATWYYGDVTFSIF